MVKNIYFAFWITLSLLWLVGCEKITHEVVYEVGGTAGSVGLSMRNASGALEQHDITPPWQTSFTAESYQRVVVNARNQTNAGTVTCRILVDGQIISEGESRGGFKTVRCEGLLTPPTPTPQP